MLVAGLTAGVFVAVAKLLLSVTGIASAVAAAAAEQLFVFGKAFVTAEPTVAVTWSSEPGYSVSVVTQVQQAVLAAAVLVVLDFVAAAAAAAASVTLVAVVEVAAEDVAAVPIVMNAAAAVVVVVDVVAEMWPLAAALALADLHPYSGPAKHKSEKIDKILRAIPPILSS